MKKSIFLFAVSFFLAVPGLRAGETPETLQIRRALANDLSGHRRADAELVLSAYHEGFVSYQGNGNLDPRAWGIQYEGKASFARALEEDLETYRYEIERTLPFIHVRLEKAMVTSLDSGKVVDRQTGAEKQIRIRSFWTLEKRKEKWLITSQVVDVGDALLPVSSTPSDAGQIADLLEEERRSWNEGKAGKITALFAEGFFGCDAFGSSDPTGWKIVFSSGEEFGRWVEKRLANTSYEIDRQLLYSTVGASGREALALTREKVTTRHKSGDVVDGMERNVLWTLRRIEGDWKITGAVYDIGLSN